MDQDERLAVLFQRLKQAWSKSEQPTLASICYDCPELKTEFRRRLGAMLAVDALFSAADAKELTTAGIALQYEAKGYSSLTYHREGGLSIILSAKDETLGREVALKWLKDKAALDPESQKRFFQEACTTAMLGHPGIIPVYTLGADGDGRSFYSMRFVSGETLQEAIDRFHLKGREASLEAGNPDFRRLIRALIIVAQTIAYTHSKEIIHRDIKPANIMLGPFGETLVLDWGLATRAQATDSLTANSTRAMGTPGFMSPEQARGDRESYRPSADLYSLGATLFAVLTGVAPIGGATSEEALTKAQIGNVPNTSEINPRIPQALSAICRKAMSPKMELRYADGQALADDLEQWLAGERVSAWREPLVVRTQRWIRKHRSFVTGAAAVLVMICVAASIVAVQASLYGEQQRLVNIELQRIQEDLSASNKELKRQSDGAKDLLRSNINALNTIASGNLSERNLKISLLREINKSTSKVADVFSDVTNAKAVNLRTKRHLAKNLSLQGAEFWLSNEFTKGVKNFKDADQLFQELEPTERGNWDFREIYAIHTLQWGMIFANHVADLEKEGKREQALDLSSLLVKLWEKRVEYAADHEGRATLDQCRRRFAIRCRDVIKTNSQSPTAEIQLACERYEQAIAGLKKLPRAEQQAAITQELIASLSARLEALKGALSN